MKKQRLPRGWTEQRPPLGDTRKTSRKAIASLTLGIASGFLFCATAIPALILAVWAIYDIEQHAETLRGRIEDFGKALLQAETEVGRSGRRFAKQLAYRQAHARERGRVNIVVVLEPVHHAVAHRRFLEHAGGAFESFIWNGDARFTRGCQRLHLPNAD